MDLPLARAVAPHLEFVTSTGSTNADLTARPATHFAVLATSHQTAGRGRLGRSWVSPPRSALAVSVLLKPDSLPLPSAGWLPLLAGVAMARAVQPLVPGREVGVKWPNDVLVEGRKVSGILSELVPGGGVVVGAGLNVALTKEQLPTEASTSLVLEGASPDGLLDRALAGYLTQLRELYDGFAATWDARELRDAVRAACESIGRNVVVLLPAGDELRGVAEDIDGDGRLVVRNKGLTAVAAGDVVHATLA